MLRCVTWVANIDLIFNFSTKVFAISAVGDLEAMAKPIPFSFSAYNIPLAWGYIDGISRLERHSLKKEHKCKLRLKNIKLSKTLLQENMLNCDVTLEVTQFTHSFPFSLCPSMASL